MSGYRVDHCPYGHATTTTWHDTEEEAMSYAKTLGNAVGWWDCEAWPVERRARGAA